MRSALSILLLLLSACAEGPPAPRQSSLDTLVSVGDHDVRLVVHHGTRPVTIFLEAGGGTGLDAAWAGLDSIIAAHTGATVVAYERVGSGKGEVGADTRPDLLLAALDSVLAACRSCSTRQRLPMLSPPCLVIQ